MCATHTEDGNAGIRREVCRAMASASSSAMHVKPEHFPAAFPAKAPGPALAGPSSRKVAAPLEANWAAQFPCGRNRSSQRNEMLLRRSNARHRSKKACLRPPCVSEWKLRARPECYHRYQQRPLGVWSGRGRPCLRVRRHWFEPRPLGTSASSPKAS